MRMPDLFILVVSLHFVRNLCTIFNNFLRASAELAIRAISSANRRVTTEISDETVIPKDLSLFKSLIKSSIKIIKSRGESIAP